MEQQPDGSPAGSQQGIDGAILALRMVQAAEAAAAAANAAVNRPDAQRNDWYKMLQNLVILIQKIEKQN